MNNFDDFKFAIEALSGGKNTVILDDMGMPSVMVPFPLLRYADVFAGGSQEPLPAFRVSNVEVPVIYVSKYQNVIVNDRAYSLPSVDPTVSITGGIDRCIQVSRNKGAGWHLTTNALYGAIALWCKQNGTFPRGNNNFGQDIGAPHEKGVPIGPRDGTGRPQRTATGSGPPSWYHNWSDSGIADLNGNVWEWSSGMRIVGGEIQVLIYGNAMRPDADMSASRGEWMAIMPDGSVVAPGTAGTVRYTQTSVAFGSVATNPVASGINMLHGMALIPEAGSVSADYNGDHFWATLDGERLPRRGGRWASGARAGVFSLNLHYVRSLVLTSLGFRSAFVSL